MTIKEEIQAMLADPPLYDRTTNVLSYEDKWNTLTNWVASLFDKFADQIDGVESGVATTVYPIGCRVAFGTNDPNILFPGTTWAPVGEGWTIATGSVTPTDDTYDGKYYKADGVVVESALKPVPVVLHHHDIPEHTHLIPTKANVGFTGVGNADPDAWETGVQAVLAGDGLAWQRPISGSPYPSGSGGYSVKGMDYVPACGVSKMYDFTRNTDGTIKTVMDYEGRSIAIFGRGEAPNPQETNDGWANKQTHWHYPELDPSTVNNPGTENATVDVTQPTVYMVFWERLS